MKYTVTSDRLVGHDRGDTVDGDDIAGHVPSLVVAGHLKPTKPPAAKKAGNS
jgi:hypothetical protein